MILYNALYIYFVFTKWGLHQYPTIRYHCDGVLGVKRREFAFGEMPIHVCLTGAEGIQ